MQNPLLRHCGRLISLLHILVRAFRILGFLLARFIVTMARPLFSNKTCSTHVSSFQSLPPKALLSTVRLWTPLHRRLFNAGFASQDLGWPRANTVHVQYIAVSTMISVFRHCLMETSGSKTTNNTGALKVQRISWLLVERGDDEKRSWLKVFYN